MAVSLAELEVLISLQTIGQGQINSLTGALGGMATGVGLAAIGVGALYEIGKSAVNNYDAQQSAISNLNQAFATQKEAVPTKQIQDFLNTNKDFISNQYDVEQGIAAATRAGLSWKDTQLLMGDALNLSINKGESFSAAMDTLIKAAAGGRSQLADLGITSTQLTATAGDLTKAQKEAATATDKKAAADRALAEDLQRLHDKHTITQNDLMHLADLKAKDLQATQDATAANQNLADVQASANTSTDRAVVLHGLLAPKIAHTTDTVSDLKRHQDDLNKDWQDFSANIGPGITTVLDGITQALDAAVQGLIALGNDLGAVGNWLEAHSSLGTSTAANTGGGGSRFATASGHANPVTSTTTVKVQVSTAPGTVAKIINHGMRT